METENDTDDIVSEGMPVDVERMRNPDFSDGVLYGFELASQMQQDLGVVRCGVCWFFGIVAAVIFYSIHKLLH